MHTIFIPGWGSDGSAFKHFSTSVEKSCLDWNACLDEAYWENCWETLQGKVTVIGWSLGSLFALKAAIHFPHKVKKIGLMAGTACLLEDNGYEGITRTALRTMQQQLRRSPQKVIENFAKHAAGSQKETIEPFLAMAEKFSAEDLDSGLLFFEKTDLRNQLNSIRCPVALWHGQEDPIIPIEQAYFLKKEVRNSVLHTFPMAHFWPLNPSHEIMSAVQSFIDF